MQSQIEALRVQIAIEGNRPLMFNRMSEETLEGLRTKEKKPKTAPRDDLRGEASKKLYLTTDTKRPFIPDHMLWSCLVAAGQFVRLDGKRMMSTAQSTVLPSFCRLEDSHCLITPEKWEVDMRPGRNPNGGEGICIVRPRFDKWSITFTLRIWSKKIDEQRIRELVDVAGSCRGLGSFAPIHKGTYGTFDVLRWDRIQEQELKAAD